VAQSQASGRPRPDDGDVDGHAPGGGAATRSAPEPLLDVRDDEPLVDLREAPSVKFTASPARADGQAPVERRDAIQRSRLIAVVIIAVLNIFDLITTYYAIAHGAHEGNPIVAWMIASRFVVVAKVSLCATLIIGAVFATRRRRRVTLASLCTAWAVVGVYSMVVVINSLTVWSHIH
jgi:hypothetical protein